MNKILAITFTLVIILPSFSAIASNTQNTSFSIKNFIDKKRGDGKTEYWALIIGVDYTNCWSYDLDAKQMYNLLQVSDYWEKDHIRLLTNENATKINIIKAFNWLDRMDDGDDVCLIYYCAHGGSGKYNYFPFDLRDSGDEYITTWRTENRLISRLINITKNFELINSWLSWRSHIITDDYFNYMLNNLDSKGVAVILHSCFSGGMIESHQIGNFFNKLRKDGRVIMTACDENETSTNFVFSENYIEGLQGYADLTINDGNDDGFVSAEEAFKYAYTRTREETYYENNPQIEDNYEGELTLAKKNLPPCNPLWIDGPIIGKTNTTYTFNVSSNDPEGDRIRFGCDWNNERFDNFYAEEDEWSDYTSKNNVSIQHKWNKPGIYNIDIKSQDEKGAEKIITGWNENPWSDTWTTIITDNECVDQFQTLFGSNIYYCHQPNSTRWLAQSFIPNLSKLSKVSLFLNLHHLYSFNLSIYIKNNLTGNNLVEICKELKKDENKWVEFDFEDITVVPGNEYFIVVKTDEYDDQIINWHNNWWHESWEEGKDYYNYQSGRPYISYDSGKTWEVLSEYWAKDDFCFITYG